MAWLWRLSLKKRILIAVVVLPVIHAAFYAVPRLVTTRPRFDKKAWQQATDLLKEEVGEAAVENGIFFIPRVPILTPYRGRAFVLAGWYYSMHMLEGRGDSCLVFHSWQWKPRVHEMTVAAITDEAAAETWRVLMYLAMVDVPAVNRSIRRYGERDMTFVDATWPIAAVMPGDETSVEWQSLRDAVAESCASRFVRSLAEKNNLAWSSERDIVANALVRSLDALIPPRCEGDSAVACAAVGWLEIVPTAEALPVLREISRRKMFRDGIRECELEHLPIIGGAFKESEFSLPDTERATWLAETIAGEPPERQLEIAWATVLDPQAPNDQLWTAFRFLQRRWPGEFTDLVCENYTEMGKMLRYGCVVQYEEFFGDDARVARLAASDAVPYIRALALYHLYRLTEDRTHLAKLVELATPVDGDDAQPVGMAAERLADIWREGSCPVDIPHFLREHLCEDNARVLLPLLAEAGGRENLDFLLSFALSGEGIALDWANWGPYVADRLVYSRDPHVLDAFIDYIESGLTKGNAELYDAVIAGLARTASRKALQALEGLLAAMEKKKPGNPEEAYDYEFLALLRDAVAELRCRCAENPLEFEFPAGLSDRRLALRSAAHPEALAAEYTLEELLAFLADKKYAARRGEIYAAIVIKRTEGEAN